MKKNEIVDGAEYVSARSNDYHLGHATVARVRVVGPVYTEPPAGYWEKRGKTRVPVEVWSTKDNAWGSRQNHQTRHIREPWAPFAERRAASERSKSEARERRNQAIDERAARLLHLIPALRHAGVPDTKARLHRKQSTRSLLEHIPDCIEEVVYEESPILNHHLLVAPLAASLEKYVEEGASLQIDAETLLRIL